jgi:hypothetical protein
MSTKSKIEKLAKEIAAQSRAKLDKAEVEKLLIEAVEKVIRDCNAVADAQGFDRKKFRRGVGEMMEKFATTNGRLV